MELRTDKPFIIAEVGSNWDCFQQAKDSISYAKQCGADAVKFQVFTTEALYGPMGKDQAANGIPIEWLPQLKEKADAVGIEFMCSAFSPELYDVVNPFVKTHKIASSETNYPQLLEKVYSYGKPVIISLGATPEGDIRRICQLVDMKRTVFMYCVSAYPSTEHNLFQIPTLSVTLGSRVGLSDHSTDIYTSLSAWKHFGTPVIEKHVNFFEATGPDAPHSLDITKFKLLCDYLNGKVDPSVVKPAGEESAMFLRHNRRLLAIKRIKQGDKLVFGENYGAFRSLKDDIVGFNPLDWQYFETRPAARDFEPGDGIRV